MLNVLCQARTKAEQNYKSSLLFRLPNLHKTPCWLLLYFLGSGTVTQFGRFCSTQIFNLRLALSPSTAIVKWSHTSLHELSPPTLFNSGIFSIQSLAEGELVLFLVVVFIDERVVGFEAAFTGRVTTVGNEIKNGIR